MNYFFKCVKLFLSVFININTTCSSRKIEFKKVNKYIFILKLTTCIQPS